MSRCYGFRGKKVPYHQSIRFLFFLYLLRWVQTGIFQVSFHVTALSWNVEGNRLLVGGKILQIWKEKSVSEEEEENPTRKFQLLYFLSRLIRRIKIMAPLLGTRYTP